jgi:hypothetical protein
MCASLFLGSSSLCRAACRTLFLCRLSDRYNWQHSTLTLYKGFGRLRPAFTSGNASAGCVCLDFVLFLSHCRSIAKRVYRVRAARRRGTAQQNSPTPTPHVPGATITRFWGTRLGLRKRPAGRTRCTACTRVFARAGCLRPQAEFTRASGRGLSRVQNLACTRDFVACCCQVAATGKSTVFRPRRGCAKKRKKLFALHRLSD